MEGDEEKGGSSTCQSAYAYTRAAYRIRVKVWLFYQRWKRSGQV